MASNEPEFLPIRGGTANTDHTGGSDDADASHPTTSSSTVEEATLTRISTSRSAREREFQSVVAGDREEYDPISFCVT